MNWTVLNEKTKWEFFYSDGLCCKIKESEKVENVGKILHFLKIICSIKQEKKRKKKKRKSDDFVTSKKNWNRSLNFGNNN